MQEPEIFEQPVRTKDPEAIVTGEETTYHTGYSGFQTNATDESSLDDYHDFVYPEGEFLFACPWSRMAVPGQDGGCICVGWTDGPSISISPSRVRQAD